MSLKNTTYSEEQEKNPEKEAEMVLDILKNYLPASQRPLKDFYQDYFPRREKSKQTDKQN